MTKLPRNNVTPIEQGRRRETDAARQLGMRPHPASGSGHIKSDMSDDTAVVEWKLCVDAKSHTVSVAQLWDTLREAERTGKEAWYIVEFAGLTMQARIERR
jgi:hypothetical protein